MQTVSAGYITASQDDDQYVKAKVDMTLADSRHVDNIKVSSSSETFEGQVKRLTSDLWWKMDTIDPFDYSGNGHHGVSSGTSDPLEIAQSRGLVLDGTGDLTGSPDPDDLSLGWIEGDGTTQIDATTTGGQDWSTITNTDTIRFETLIQPNDWTPASLRGIIGQPGGSTVVGFNLQTAGQLRLIITTDGANDTDVTSSNNMPTVASVADGDAAWVAFEYDAATGIVDFEYSLQTDIRDPALITWQTLEAGLAGTALGTDAISAGAGLKLADIGTQEFDGKVFVGRVLINGWVKFYTDLFVDADDGDSSWVGSDGLIWTATGDTVSHGVGSIDVMTLVSLDDWTPSAGQTFVAHYRADTNLKSWTFKIFIGGQLTITGSFDGSATDVNQLSDTGLGFTDGTKHWIRLTRDWATGDITYYYSTVSIELPYDEVLWTDHGTDSDSAGPLFNSSSQFSIGTDGNLQLPMAGRVYATAVLGTTSTDGNTIEVVNASFIDSAQFVAAVGSGVDANSNTWTHVDHAFIDGTLPIEFYDFGALEFVNAPATLDQYIAASPYGLPGTSVTVSAWMNWDDPSTGDDMLPMTISTGAVAADIAVQLTNDAGSYELVLSNGSTLYNITTTASIPTGWHQVSIVITPTDWYFYIDGVEEDTAAWTGPINLAVLAAGVGVFFNGDINDFTIFDTVFTPKMVSSLYESGINAEANTYVDKWFNPEQLLNGTEEEGIPWGLADALQADGSTIVANGDILALAETPDPEIEYGYYTREVSDASGDFLGNESVYAEFDERIANKVRFTTSHYLGRIKTATLYYKDTNDVWQSDAATLAVGDTDYTWDLGGDLNIRGVGIKVLSTHNPFDVGRVYELIPLFEKTVTNEDYIISMDVNDVRENLDMTIPIGNTAANTFNLSLDNTEQIWSPDGAGTYSEYMISDIILKPYITYEDVPSEWLSKGIFYADSINTSGDSMTVEIPCRDYSKYFQSAIIERGIFFENETVGNAVSKLAQLYGVPYNKITKFDHFWNSMEALQPVGMWKLDDPYVYNDAVDTYENAGQFLRMTSSARAQADSGDHDEFVQNFVIDVDLALHDWVSGADQFIAGQSATGQYMWGVFVDATGHLGLSISNDGSALLTVTTTDPLGYDDHRRCYLRIIRNGSKVSFWKSFDDGLGFELIEEVAGLTNAAIFAGTSTVRIGSDHINAIPCDGVDFYSLKTYQGLNVPGDEDNDPEEPEIIIDVDFSNFEQFGLGATFGTADDGVVWTLINNAKEAEFVTTFTDSIGGHNGAGFVIDWREVATGAAGLLPGYPDHATKFDITGNNRQGILVDNTAPFEQCKTGMTLMAFLQIDETPDEQERLISWADGAGGNDSKTFDLMINSSSQIQFRIRDTGETLNANNTTTATVTVGEPSFIVARWDPASNVMDIWINDVQQTFGAASFEEAYVNLDTPIAIGRHSTAETKGMEGTMQGVAIFDKVLTDTVIEDLYISSQIAKVDVFPYLYGIDQSVWDIMLEWTTADVGIFYFDETGNLVYDNRPTLNEGVITRHAVSQHSFEEDVDIVSGDRIAEIIANQITIIVNPISTINTGRQGVWRAETGESLVVTKLSEAFDKNEDQSITVASTDNPLWLDSGFFKIDDEIMSYESKTGRTLDDLERGLFDTIPAEHGNVEWQFENGSIEGMRDFFNCDLSIVDTESQLGTHSMKCVVTDEDEGVDRVDIIGPKSEEGTPVSSGTIDLSVYIFAETAARDMEVGLNWYKDDGTYLSTDYGTQSATTLGAWKEYTFSGSRVSTAVYCTPHIKSDNSEEDDVFYFDNIVLSGDIRKKVREVRVYDIEYDSKPVIGVKDAFIVAVEFDGTVDIDKQNLDEFGGQIVLSANRKNAIGAIVLLEGTDPVTELDYFFSISGIPLVESSESDEVTEIDGELTGSLRRHQIYDLTIDNRFIQSKELAQKIADYLLLHYKNPVPVLNLTTLGVPYLQLGDRIEVAAYDQLSITNKEFWIIEQSLTYDGGLENTYTLREVS